MFKCTLDAFLAVCGLDRGGGTGSCGISSTGAEAMTKTRLTSAGLISNQSPSITSTNTNTTPIDVENCNISISKDSITIVPNDVDDGGGVTSGTGDGSGTNAIGSNDRRNDVDGGGGVSSSSSGVMYVSSSASGSGGSYFRCLHTEAEITSLVHQAWQRLPSSSSSMRVEEDYRSEAIRLAKQVQNTYIHKLSYIRSLTHSLPPSLAQPLFHTLHNTPP